MKILLLTIDSGKPDWFLEFSQDYERKISGFLKFECQRIKAKNLGRSRNEEKKSLESQEILKRLEERDVVILFDEKGKSLDTKAFTDQSVKLFESGSSRIVFVIGGAFGASEELKKRSKQIWKLSDLTLNHLVAQVVALEQIYRSLTIWKGIPYHNE
jgi:23S rRNA (pseudouridine1915-N3)-methyltransferase